MLRFVTKRPWFTLAILTVAACVVVGPVRVGHAYGHAASVAVNLIVGFARGVWSGI